MSNASDDDFKNSLPGESDDHPDSGMPRQLRTQADGDETLSAAEAEAGGITTPVYGDDDIDPNRGDD